MSTLISSKLKATVQTKNYLEEISPRYNNYEA